jgi:hypothetical protein
MLAATNGGGVLDVSDCPWEQSYNHWGRSRHSRAHVKVFSVQAAWARWWQHKKRCCAPLQFQQLLVRGGKVQMSTSASGAEQAERGEATNLELGRD